MNHEQTNEALVTQQASNKARVAPAPIEVSSDFLLEGSTFTHLSSPQALTPYQQVLIKTKSILDQQYQYNLSLVQFAQTAFEDFLQLCFDNGLMIESVRDKLLSLDSNSRAVILEGFLQNLDCDVQRYHSFLSAYQDAEDILECLYFRIVLELDYLQTDQGTAIYKEQINFSLLDKKERHRQEKSAIKRRNKQDERLNDYCILKEICHKIEDVIDPEYVALIKTAERFYSIQTKSYCRKISFASMVAKANNNILDFHKQSKACLVELDAINDFLQKEFEEDKKPNVPCDDIFQSLFQRRIKIIEVTQSIEDIKELSFEQSYPHFCQIRNAIAQSKIELEAVVAANVLARQTKINIFKLAQEQKECKMANIEVLSRQHFGFVVNQVAQKALLRNFRVEQAAKAKKWQEKYDLAKAREAQENTRVLTKNMNLQFMSRWSEKLSKTSTALPKDAQILLERLLDGQHLRNIGFSGVEALIESLGGVATPNSGSMVRFSLNGHSIVVHKPHGGAHLDETVSFGTLHRLKAFLITAGISTTMVHSPNASRYKP